MKLLIATSHAGKLAEYQRYFSVLNADLLQLRYVAAGDLEIEETGDSFEANAEIKARAGARLSGLLTVADDSGLEVDALGGAPGIHTARYGGIGLKQVERRRRLLSALDGLAAPERSARFVCVIAIVAPIWDELVLARGECEGKIALRDHDAGEGFGYDPIFIPQGYALTFGQLRPELKDGLSHRARAATLALPILQEIISRMPGDGTT